MEIRGHIIQILALKEDNKKLTLTTVGFIFIKDRSTLVFNPSLKDKGLGKIHSTWHKDGTLTFQDGKGNIISKDKRKPLDKFKGQNQFLFQTYTDINFNLDYKQRDDDGLFLIDLRKFTRGLGFSIHICDYNNINKATKQFEDKPNRQTFIYWKSNPKIVIVAFEN